MGVLAFVWTFTIAQNYLGKQSNCPVLDEEQPKVQVDHTMEKMEENQGNLMGDNGNSDETDAVVGHVGPSSARSPIERDSETYNMNHSKRGRALIFSQKDFNSDLKLDSRSGSPKEEKRLKLSLEALNFKVSLFNDLTVEQLTTEIAKLAEEDHSDRDCIIIALMSHGGDGILYAKDAQYKPECLWSNFTSDKCPSLAGKPKLFFIQACQGSRTDSGTMLQRKTETDGPDGSDVPYKIPTHADFMIVYSTIPGRDTTNGSFFIEALCYALSELKLDKEDLLSIVTTASNIVAFHFETNTSVTLTCLLTRKVFFKKIEKHVKKPYFLDVGTKLENKENNWNFETYASRRN